MHKESFSERILHLNTQNKLIIFGIIISSFVIVSTAWMVINSNQQTISESYRNFGQVVANSLAPETIVILSTNTLKESREKLDQLALSIIENNKDIALIRIMNDKKEIIYQSGDPKSQKIDSEDMVFAPMYDSAGEYYGTVDVFLTGYTKDLVKKTTRFSLIVIFSLAWLISSLAVLLNTYLITRNLSHIVEGVKRVSIGEFGYRVLSKDLWGEVKQLVEAFNDMSARLRQYEERNIDQLTYERNKLEAVLLSIANGVVVCDRCDEIVIVNNAALDMLNISSNEIIGMRILDYLDENGNKCFEKVIKKFKDTPLEFLEKEPLITQLPISIRTFKVITSPIFDFHQEYLGYTLILHDITKETEIDKMKSDFISNVSHELRTPVTVLRSYVDTLAHYGEEFDEQTKNEFMLTIDDHVSRLNEMVNNILDFSRLEKEEIELDLDLNDILPIIELTVKSIEKLAEDKNITISKAFESDLPQVYINSDAIEKVLRNLLSNAIKYTMEGGRIKVKVETDRTAEYVEVSVIDNGIGIAKEDLPKLFNRFYRVENKVHTEVGTGIGLEIVKKAIEKHNGEVFVDSEPGRGSTFGFKLPIVKDMRHQEPGECSVDYSADETSEDTDHIYENRSEEYINEEISDQEESETNV
jgi:two-component system sensor histidine kinase NblS